MIQNLFQIPVWYDYVDPNTYNKEELLTTIETNYNIDNHRNKWDGLCNMHHSNNDYDNQKFFDMNYNILQVVYQNKINKFVSEVLGELSNVVCNIKIVNYTAMMGGGHMMKHNHVDPNCDFVGVHYVKFKEGQHSNIRFWNPHTSFTWFPDYHQIYNRIGVCTNNYEFPIKEDLVVIYPAFLDHDIPVQQETNSLRASIAFHIKFSEGDLNE